MEIYCSHCGEKITNLNNISIDENGKFLCNICRTHHYVSCVHCGAYILRSEHRNSCNNCLDKVYNCPINAYSTKPSPTFKNKNGVNGDLNNRYYGLEMEYSYTNYNGVFAVWNNLYKNRFIYNKSDASLSNGVEVVTNPLDKGSLKKLLTDMESGFELIKKDKDYRYNAGLHIHVNRKSIPSIAILKLSYMLNGTSTQTEKAILLYLAERESLSQAKDKQVHDHYCSVGTIGDMSGLKYNEANRHIALNLRNKNTVEFRIFKSSADKDVILSYIEMVDTMIDFAENTPFNKCNLNNYFIYLSTHTSNKILLDKLNEVKDMINDTVIRAFKFDMDSVMSDVDIGYYWILYRILKVSRGISNLKRLLPKAKDYNRWNIDELYWNYSVRDELTQTTLGRDVISKMIDNLKNDIKERVTLCA